MSQKELVDQFLAKATVELYNEIEDKEYVLEIVKEHPFTVRTLYFLDTIGEKRRDKIDFARDALSSNEKDLFYELVHTNMNQSEINYCAASAAYFNCFDEMKYLIKGVENKDGVTICANDWNAMAISAAKGNHQDILYYVIGRGADDWNGIAVSAASEEIVYEMIRRGANKLVAITKEAIDNCCYNLACSVIDRIHTLGDLEHLANYAAEEGSEIVLKHIINGEISRKKDFNLNDIAYSAAKGGNISMVKEMISGIKCKNGVTVRANNYVAIAKGAGEGKHRDILDYALNVQRDILYAMYSLK